MTEERETCDWCGEKLQDVQPLCSCCIDDTNDFHGQDRDESHWDGYDDDPCDCDMDYEDDGQPSEYEEWQDLYGGDDWDHGQYDEY